MSDGVTVRAPVLTAPDPHKPGPAAPARSRGCGGEVEPDGGELPGTGKGSGESGYFWRSLAIRISRSAALRGHGNHLVFEITALAAELGSRRTVGGAAA
jgi:hypothetical protein